MASHIIYEFVRNNKGKPIGCIAAVAEAGGTGKHYALGYSLCNKNDTFDKHLARIKAVGRANMYMPIHIDNFPHTIRKHVPKMLNRAQRYFQGKSHSPGQID